MQVLIAPDAFKDSLTAEQVSQAMKRAVLQFDADARCYFLSASDGGEGFLEAVKAYRPDVEQIDVETRDPLGRPLWAPYLFEPQTATAFVELAKASGIELLTDAERDPTQTTTLGTGVQIADAIDRGARTVYIGLGGSATNDAATGIAHALGYRFKDVQGQDLKPCGFSLERIHRIQAPARKTGARFFAINDVSNPLYGPEGAAYIYARQKGGSDTQIEELDRGLQHLDLLVETHLGKQVAGVPGSGAAGGSGYGLKAFLDAEFISGTSFILQLASFEQKVKEWQIDLILTGEGKIDEQTRFGKFVYGLAQQAGQHAIPVRAVCGKLDLDPAGVQALGIELAAQLFDPALPAAYSFTHAEALVEQRTLALLQT